MLFGNGGTCGNTITTRGYRLVNGNTKSCGCFRLEVVRNGEHHKRARKKDVAFRQYLSQQEKQCKNQKSFLGVNRRGVQSVYILPCYYMGTAAVGAAQNKHDVYVCNGIDRRDNSKGYTVENCVPCCFEVNAMKRDFSREVYCTLQVAERAAHVNTII